MCNEERNIWIQSFLNNESNFIARSQISMIFYSILHILTQLIQIFNIVFTDLL